MNWEEILGNLGWSGLLAWALTYVFKLYTQVQEARIKAMDGLIADQAKRIERCEERADSCESDRRMIHDLLRKDTVALHQMIADYFPRKNSKHKDDA